MRWLLYGPMTAAVAEALVRHGHKVQNMNDVNLPPQTDPLIVLNAARQAQLDVLTTDGRLAEAPLAAKMPFGRSIVYLQLEGGEVEQDDAIDRLFERYKRLTPGRLYTVTASRVKVRQLPASA
jgi:hypothetical protein